MCCCIKTKRTILVLKSKHIFLRKLAPTDVDLMMDWENDVNNWNVSGTVKPFSKQEIKQFVNSNHDITENGQIRYVICLNSCNTSIGTMDLFEYDVKTKRVGIGVLIAKTAFRNKGYASEALDLISNYCSNELNIVTIFCNIQKDNIISIRLFEKNGFVFDKEHLLFENKVNYYKKNLQGV